MVSLSDLPVRDDLRGAEPYGAPQLEVPITLNVNENTHAVPDHVAEHIVAEVDAVVRGLNRYPDREFTGLRERLAGYLGHGLGSEHIWAANGSNEVLQHIMQTFGGPRRRALGFPPSYSMHPLITAGTGTEWVTADRDPGYELSPETAVRAIESLRPDVTFICTPNNPTGTPVGLDTIAAAYEATQGIVIVDEAYAEFMPDGEPSALTLLEGRERLLVSRTMSKAFAFAGARVGYLAAHPVAIDALRLVRLPYHLSAITQAAASAAIDYADDMLAMVDDIRTQRDRLLLELPKLGLHPWRSSANFVLFGGLDDAPAVFRALLERGILIRDVGIPGHLRVTAGTEYETSAFLGALAEIVGVTERRA